jgi:hypothetical protein
MPDYRATLLIDAKSARVVEFQNFATSSFATILSEARKYKLALTLAHQYIAPEDLQKAALGNCANCGSA